MVSCEQPSSTRAGANFQPASGTARFARVASRSPGPLRIEEMQAGGVSLGQPHELEVPLTPSFSARGNGAAIRKLRAESVRPLRTTQLGRTRPELRLGSAARGRLVPTRAGRRCSARAFGSPPGPFRGWPYAQLVAYQDDVGPGGTQGPDCLRRKPGRSTAPVLLGQSGPLRYAIVLALDDLVDLKHLGARPKARPQRPSAPASQALTERVELLSRVPDLADSEVTLRTESDVVGESLRRPVVPNASRRRTVSSYCSLVTAGAALKRARTLDVRSPTLAVTESGLMVAIRPPSIDAPDPGGEPNAQALQRGPAGGRNYAGNQ
jgi:hypothetical protein